MAVGPVQLIVLGFDHPNFQGEVLAELEKLRDSDTIRVIDALAVSKDADGDVTILKASNLTQDESIELGAKIGALIGIGAAGDDPEAVEEIPNDTAAALLLIEHHWAVGLRDAVARAGGFRISDGFVSPIDLVEIGAMTREDAEAHALVDTR